MGLLDDMRAEKIVKGPPCSVGIMLESMTAQEQEEFASACADSTIASSVIARVLARRGHEVRKESIRRHRKGECRCE
jgi:hypothetical protein